MRRYYTGIGSRSAPAPVLKQMYALGAALAAQGYTLRSGHADGADMAFEDGCDSASGQKDIFLPWRGFNDSQSVNYRVDERAYELAASVHPAWMRLSYGSKKLHGRNTYQVLGLGLDSPSDFVVCWTPDGCTGPASRTKHTGGTATAILLAERHNVPVFNLFHADAYVALLDNMGLKRPTR